MTTSVNSSRLMKGALVGVDAMNPLASVVVFQYNPDTMTRRLEARSTGGGDTSDRSEAFRLTGPPKETITLNIEVDATDQLWGAQNGTGYFPRVKRYAGRRTEESRLYPKV